MPKSTRQEVIDAAEDLSHFTPHHQTRGNRWVCPYCWAKAPEEVDKQVLWDWLARPSNHKPTCPWRILKQALANLD